METFSCPLRLVSHQVPSRYGLRPCRVQRGEVPHMLGVQKKLKHGQEVIFVRRCLVWCQLILVTVLPACSTLACSSGLQLWSEFKFHGLRAWKVRVEGLGFQISASDMRTAKTDTSHLFKLFRALLSQPLTESPLTPLRNPIHSSPNLCGGECL